VKLDRIQQQRQEPAHRVVTGEHLLAMTFLRRAGELPDLLDSLGERLAAKANDDLRAQLVVGNRLVQDQRRSVSEAQASGIDRRRAPKPLRALTRACARCSMSSNTVGTWSSTSSRAACSESVANAASVASRRSSPRSSMSPARRVRASTTSARSRANGSSAIPVSSGATGRSSRSLLSASSTPSAVGFTGPWRSRSYGVSPSSPGATSSASRPSRSASVNGPATSVQPRSFARWRTAPTTRHSTLAPGNSTFEATR
jgi:hypothetical protein